MNKREFLIQAKNAGLSRDQALKAMQDYETQYGFTSNNEPSAQNTQAQQPSAIEPPPQFTPLNFEDTFKKAKRMGDSEAPTASLTIDTSNPNPKPGPRNLMDKIHDASFPSLKEGKITPMKMAMAPFEFAGTPARFLGAMSEKTGVANKMRGMLDQKPIDTSNQSMLDLTEDTDKGLLQPVRQAVHKGTEEWPAFARKATRLGTDIATGIGEDPSALLAGGLGAVSKVGKVGGKAVSKVPLVNKLPIAPVKPSGVTKEALQDVSQGFKFTPTQIADEKFGPRANLEQFAQQNPFTNHIPGEIAENNFNAIQNVVSRNAKRLGADDPNVLNKTARGDEIKNKFVEAKKKAGQNFEEGEDRLKNVAQTKIENFIESSPNGVVKVPSKDIVKQTAIKKIDDYLDGVGYAPGKERNTGHTKAVIDKVVKFKQDLSNVDNLTDLVNQKRSFASEVFTGKKQNLYDDKGERFLKGVNDQLNQAIEEVVQKTLGKEGDDIVNVYKSINKQYSDVINATKGPSKKLNIFENSQNVVNNISKLNVEDIKALRNSENESLRTIHEELSRGAFESVMGRALTKENQISPDKIVTQWNKLDQGVKDALFPKELISDMDLLTKNINTSNINQMSKINPSGTSRGVALWGIFTDPKQAVLALMQGMAVKHYYKTGELYRESLFNFAKSAKGKILNANESLKKLQKFRVFAQETTGSR